MRQETRAKRQLEIENAAYALLEEEGFAGATMQAVAKRAGASMETLYKWYGNKDGLFSALVSRNAQQVKETLELRPDPKADGLHTLAKLGPQLLRLLTGERAIALNRAAAVDATGQLGAAIAQSGRDTIAPLIADLFTQIAHEKLHGITNAQEASEIYLGVLVGDLQIRRVISQIEPLSHAECKARSKRTISLIKRVYQE